MARFTHVLMKKLGTNNTAVIAPSAPITGTEHSRLLASDNEAGDSFGISVSISGDGNTAIVGAFGEDTGGSQAGAAYIYTRSGSTWTEQQKIQANDIQDSTLFGYSVAISNDGSTAIVGASGDNAVAGGSGSAYVFTRSGSVWTQQEKMRAPTPTFGAAFGYSVSINGDGNTVIVGTINDALFTGAAYVFTRSGSVWTLQDKLTASDAQEQSRFGNSVTLNDDGNTAIVGANYEDTGGIDAGAAYIFTRNGSIWTEQQKIQASDLEAGDQYGASVSVSDDGNTAIIGSYKDDDTATDAGAVYIYTRSGSTWTEQQKIQANDAGATDYFGWSVSINGGGNIAIVGAVNEQSVGTFGGAAYIYTRSGSTWTEQQKLQASDLEAGDWFGNSVSISSDGSTAIIGARNEDTGGIDAGAAYIFV